MTHMNDYSSIEGCIRQTCDLQMETTTTQPHVYMDDQMYICSCESADIDFIKHKRAQQAQHDGSDTSNS